MQVSETPEKTPFDLHKQATRYLAQKQFEKAVAACQEALKLQPDFLLAHSTMGLARQLQGELEEAKSWYERALELKPDWAEVHANLGSIYFQQQQWREALQAYQTSLHFQPNQPVIYRNLYTVWIQLNQPEEATDSWYQALMLEPKFVTPQDYLDFGKSLIEKGKVDFAINLFSQGVNTYPTWALIHYWLGEALNRQQQWEEAISAYQKAIELNSELNHFHQSLGDALVQVKRFEEAIACYQKAIELQPDFSWTYHQLGNALSEQEKWEEAVVAYCQAISLNPKFFGSYYKLGKIRFQTGDIEEAVSWYRQAIAINPDAYWLHYEMGDALSEKQQWRQAIKVYRQAIELEPNVDWLYPKLAKVYSEVQQWEEALNTYLQAVELNINNLWLLDEFTEKLVEVKQIPMAISLCRKSLQIHPKAHKLYYHIGNFYKVQGQWDDAILAYQNAIKINATIADYYAKLGETWLQKKEYDQALAYLMEALQIQPDLIKVYENIAEILQVQGKAEDALKCYNYKDLPEYILERYCLISPEQLITSDFCSDVNYISVYPASEIPLNPSRTVSQFHPSFIYSQAGTRNGFLVTLNNGRVWGDLATSAVFTAKNELLTDISTGCAELVLGSRKLPPVHHINGTVAFLTVRWGEAFFHWMYDVLPGLHLIAKSGIALESIDYFVFNNTRFPYQKETLERLGIPREKIIESIYQPHIQAKKLIVPAPNLFQNQSATPEWICQFLKQQFLSEELRSVTPHRRIFISREKAGSRNVVNQEELIQRLKALNFETVVLESLTFAEQAELMATASVVVAPHGAGLSNIVFCQPGTKIIELFAPSYVPPCYRIISNVCQLEHYYLIGELVENPETSLNHSGRLDMRINLDDLISLLEVADVN